MNELSPRIEKAIKKGSAALKKLQLPDGSFDHSLLHTSLVLSSLSSIKPNPALTPVKKQAARFLSSQKKSFSTLAAAKETFSLLSALYLYHPSTLDGETLAEAISFLTQAEITEGGPYRLGKKIDFDFNVFIAYFLSLQEISLPHLDAFIEAKIEEKKFYSQFHDQPLTIYLLSRFYQGKNKEKILNFLERQKVKDKIKKNPFFWALYLSSRANFGRQIDPKDFNRLLSFSPLTATGSPALTTAFCLEALSKCSPSPPTIKKNSLREGEVLYRETLRRMKARSSSLPLDLKKEANQWLDTLVKTDKDRQRVLMPYFFKLALGDRAEKIDDELLINLGMANLYGWLAYTVYDNFLDNEGCPPSLSAANVALRELTRIFESTLPGTGFALFFEKIMDQLDGANTWETKSARLKIKDNVLFSSKTALPQWGNYQRLAWRSLGHALGPAAILFALGYPENSPEIKNLTLFFEHLIIAKQLNDDIHDWEKDLQAGQATPVVTQTLLETNYRKKESFLRLIPKMQKTFWRKTIKVVCKEVLNHVRLAKESLKMITVVQNPERLESLLLPLEAAAKKALAEKKKAASFLKSIYPEASPKIE